MQNNAQIYSPEERQKSFERALLLIEDGAKNWRDSIKAGDPFALTCAVQNLRFDGWFFHNCLPGMVVNHFVRVERHVFETSESFLEWLAEQTKIESDSKKTELQKTIEESREKFRKKLETLSQLKVDF